MPSAKKSLKKSAKKAPPRRPAAAPKPKAREAQGEAGRLAMLEAMIESIPQGICVLDRNFKLRTTNRRFGALLGLPKALTQPGTDFADIIRHNAEKGDYGAVDIETRVAERTKSVRFADQYFNVRTLPNGRVLEIHGVRIGSGERIITYTDVSERGASERERERLSQILLDAIETIPQGFALIRRGPAHLPVQYLLRRSSPRAEGNAGGLERRGDRAARRRADEILRRRSSRYG